MNTSESEGDLVRPSSPATTEELQAQCDQLRHFFVLALASIVVVCLAVSVFMGKQWRTVKAQVEEQRKTVQNMWTEYGRTTQPRVRNFVQSLQGYAAQNRDFQPILEKYRRPLGEYFVATSAAAPPQAAPTSPK